MAGTKKGIVNKLIHLTVSLPDAPDLTLTDLPGIVRTPVGEHLIMSCMCGDTSIRDMICRNLQIGLQAMFVQQSTATYMCTSVTLQVYVYVSGFSGSKFCVAGDQPADIEQQVKRLIIEHATGNDKDALYMHMTWHFTLACQPCKQMYINVQVCMAACIHEQLP